MTDAAAAASDWHDFVHLALQATRRRDVGPPQCDAWARALAAGSLTPAALLRELLRDHPEPPYDYARDARITRFRNADVDRLSARLRTERPIDQAHFDTCWRQRFAELGSGAPEQELREYGEFHRRRFLEAIQALAILLEDQPRPRVLDCGISVFTALYKRLLPKIELATIDRSVDSAHDAFLARASAAAGATAHATVDWNDPAAVQADVRAALGEFNLIVFTEVLEHLTVHPVHVLRNLLSLLRPGGVVYVTTPNRFAAGHLRRIAQRMDPQHVFPYEGNSTGAHHFHEYCMADLLAYSAEAGGEPIAFHFSDCWDPEPVEPEDERSNMVAVIRRPR